MNFFIKKSFRFFAVSMVLVISIFSSVLVASAAEIIYYESVSPQVVSYVPKDAFCVSVVPSKTSVKKGEEFYVDYIIRNNPGFVLYSFTFNYNQNIVEPVFHSSAPEACEVTYKIGSYDEIIFYNDEINEMMQTAKDDGYLYYCKVLMSSNYLSEASNDGNIIRVYYKAINEGSSDINLKNLNGAMFVDKDGKNIPVYIENSSVNVN